MKHENLMITIITHLSVLINIFSLFIISFRLCPCKRALTIEQIAYLSECSNINVWFVAALLLELLLGKIQHPVNTV